MDSGEQLKGAISAISQSDPLIKLLDQVRLGRMKANDVGLRAIVESWLTTYQKVVGTAGLTKQALRQIDPTPRTAELAQIGVIKEDHPAMTGLQSAFRQALDRAPE
ncbi:hypothetical protein [Petrachloros mirabilis]